MLKFSRLVATQRVTNPVREVVQGTRVVHPIQGAGHVEDIDPSMPYL